MAAAGGDTEGAAATGVGEPGGGSEPCPRCGEAAVRVGGECGRCGLDAVRYRAYLAAVAVPPPLPPASPPGPPAAGIGRRVQAFVLDYLFIVLVRWAWVGAAGLAWDADAESSRVFAAATAALPVAWGGAYIVLAHWLWGQTLGKAALGIRVERLDGERVGLVALTGRLLVAAVGLGLPLLAGLARADRRGLHDLLAGTRVVRVDREADARRAARAAAPAAP